MNDKVGNQRACITGDENGGSRKGRRGEEHIFALHDSGKGNIYLGDRKLWNACMD